MDELEGVRVPLGPVADDPRFAGRECAEIDLRGRQHLGPSGPASSDRLNSRPSTNCSAKHGLPSRASAAQSARQFAAVRQVTTESSPARRGVLVDGLDDHRAGNRDLGRVGPVPRPESAGRPRAGASWSAACRWSPTRPAPGAGVGQSRASSSEARDAAGDRCRPSLRSG